MRRLAVVLVSVCLLSAMPVGQHAQTSSPDQQVVQIKGLRDRVTIRRDERGIPYIEDQNDDDLYFGQGYATAAPQSLPSTFSDASRSISRFPHVFRQVQADVGKCNVM